MCFTRFIGFQQVISRRCHLARIGCQKSRWETMGVLFHRVNNKIKDKNCDNQSLFMMRHEFYFCGISWRQCECMAYTVTCDGQPMYESVLYRFLYGKRGSVRKKIRNAVHLQHLSGVCTISALLLTEYSTLTSGNASITQDNTADP